MAGSVSVVIPTFKRDALLLEAVGSVISCAPRVSEVIVVDDDRADPTELNALLGGLAVSRDVVVRGLCRQVSAPERRGAQACRNIGLEEASGDYILFLDDDDLLDAKGLEERAAILDRRPDLDFVVGPALPFRDSPESCSGEPYPIDTDGDDLLAFLGGRVVWMTSGPLWRPRALGAIGGWDEAVRFNQDNELHVRALACGLSYEKVYSVAYRYRLSSAGSMSSNPDGHAGGHRGYSLARALEVVTRNRAWTPVRRRAARRNIVRMAFECLRQGGRKSSALVPVRAGRAAGCLSAWSFLEIVVLIQFWGLRFAGRNVSQSLMHRRFLRSAV